VAAQIVDRRGFGIALTPAERLAAFALGQDCCAEDDAVMSSSLTKRGKNNNITYRLYLVTVRPRVCHATA